MKNKIILCAFVGFLSTVGILAQSVVTTAVTLNEEKAQQSCFTSSRFYLKSFSRGGEKALPLLEETVEKELISTDQSKASNYWQYQPLVFPVGSEVEADYTISGTYYYDSGISTGESVYHEKTGALRLPYFVTAKKHYANLDIIFTFVYKDGSPTRKDTISIHKESVETPGKKYYDVSKLEAQLEEMIKAKLHYYTNLMDYKQIQINFPKVKIKDKAIKAEYQSIKDLLKDGEYEKAGKIVKKAYEANPTPELSQALGICYELVGNYPMAEEYYKALPNFHIKTRMKKNMALLEKVQSMGFEPQFIEF